MYQPFKTISVFTVALFCVAAFGALAQETAAPAQSVSEPTGEESSILDEKKLSDIAVDFKAIYRLAEYCDDLAPCVTVIRKLTDHNLEMLREPRGDGSYRWASFQRVETGRVSKEAEILKVQSEATLDTLEVTGKNAYSIVVSVPKKRSFFSSNNKVFVRDVSVETTSSDGKTRTQEIPVNVWVEPGDAHSIPLGDIALSARVKVNVGVEAGDKKAVASAALLQGGLVDDPMNPYYGAVKRLNAIAAISTEKSVSRAQLKSVSEEAVLELPGEMETMMKLRDIGIKRLRQIAESGETTGTVAVGDATPDVVHELSKASKMLSGTVAEQEEGRAALQSLIEKLSPPVPVTTPETAETPKTN